jgi:type IV secretion system protein VirB11
MTTAYEQLDEIMPPLRRFLDNPKTEDVAMQKPGEAWVNEGGKWRREPVPVDTEMMWEIAKLSGSLHRENVDEYSPILDTELHTGERLNSCLPPTMLNTYSLTIRKHDNVIHPTSTIAKRYRTEGWNRWRRLRAGRDLEQHIALFKAGDIDGFMEASARSKLNILNVAPTGAGKTTFSKTVCSAISEEERLITIEDALELDLNQPNVVRMLLNDVVDMAFQIKATLRMRPDRVMVQELRDPAAIWTLLSYVTPAHPGVVCTIHGYDPAAALRRAGMLIRSAPEGRGMNTDDIIELLTTTVDVIVPLELHKDGVRGISPVWFVGDPDGESIADLMRS